MVGTMHQDILQKVTGDILDLFRSDPAFKREIPMKDYHGFEKGRIPPDPLRGIASKYEVTAEQLQAELVRVVQDLSDEIHLHRHSRAYCIVLGEQEGFEAPREGFVFLANKWSPVFAGETIDIPPATAHGFTVKPGGILYFLSVQTPPIEDGHGHDDYERIAGMEKPF